MVLNSGDVQEGMEVFGSAGDKLGTVKSVFADGGNANDLGGPVGDIEIETVEVVETPVRDTGFNAGDAGTAYTDADMGSTVGGSTGMPGTDTGTSYGGTTGMDTGSTIGGTGSSYSDTPGSTFGGADSFGTSGGNGYFEVHHGGLLGIGGESLYIPFDVIASVDPGNSVTLSVTKDEAVNMYNEKPAFLSQTSS